MPASSRACDPGQQEMHFPEPRDPQNQLAAGLFLVARLAVRPKSQLAETHCAARDDCTAGNRIANTGRLFRIQLGSV